MRRRVGPTGLRQTFNPLMTVTRRIRSPGRARNKPLKPLRAGMPGDLGEPRGDYARVLCFISHARLRVHWAPGIPHALCFSGRRLHAQLGRSAPRERGGVSQRHCEEPTGRANARPTTGSATKQSIFLLCDQTGLLRFARNDGQCFGCLRIESEMRARRVSTIWITSPRLRGEVEAEGFG